MNERFTYFKSPYFDLALGGFSLLVGLISTFNGATIARFGRVINRADEPREFWEVVAGYYLIAVCFVAYFFYELR